MMDLQRGLGLERVGAVTSAVVRNIRDNCVQCFLSRIETSSQKSKYPGVDVCG